MYQNGCDPPISLGSAIDSFQANICAYRRVVMYFIESIDDQDCLFVAEEDIQLAAMLVFDCTYITCVVLFFQ